MLRDERELLADLKRACNQAGPFVLEFIAGELPIEAEEAYAYLLGDIADRLLAHAKARKGLIIDGEPTPLVIESQAVIVDYESRGLPPRDKTSHDPEP